ncbi:TetR/AcrR family transcriptional regulator [Methylocapsa sp. S129]|uniref:TetR/AcrR family transcriptional regulator n=1 Tax=Methylocapsa sp. S129 TaxID=1641869 RepID=UPI00131DE041|nr:TetR/AcrR family transcriptional regulator [Methylocapsa sp. S129]
MNIVRRTSEETRQCILVAAWDLFRQIGFRKTTIADIAAALRMSSANIYRFFPSKDALTEAICRNLLGGLLEAARALAAGPGAAGERIRAVLLFLHRNHREQMINEKRVHEVVAVAMEQNWTAIEEFLEACDAVIVGLVGEGQANGEFGPGDPVLLGERTMAACACILHPDMIAECSGDDPDADAQGVIDFVLRALANKNPPAPLQSLE